MSDRMTAIVIRGDFSGAEYAALVDCIRRFDDARPYARFEIVGVDPTSSAIATAERMLRETLPPLPGRETSFATIPTPLILAAPDLLAACKAQHSAIDRLFAALIVSVRGFMPSESGQPWEAMLAGNEAIKKATGR